MGRFSLLAFILLLSACAGMPQAPNAPLTLKPVAFDDLPGWGRDDLTQALPALRRSCERIMNEPPNKPHAPLKEAGTNAQWRPICLSFLALNKPDRVALRVFFEARFQPYEASAGWTKEGLFTGYYEASLRGSLKKHGPYRYPLYLRPADLVMVDLGEFREELRGQRIAGRPVNGQLKPYEDRAAITSGKWPHNDAAFVYVDNAADAFFVQVQGSGMVKLDDGATLRIGYAGQNGWPYYAIGRELIKRGALTQDNVSMQSIRAWLASHPNEADEIMNTNKSYVFFKPMTGDGPKGAEGVTLTPGRSLAVDHSKIPYGAPLWVTTQGPPSMARLMVAQDTGGAITGAVRGDVFWGYGPEAEKLAGPMKAKGRYWLLLPKINTPPAGIPSAPHSAAPRRQPSKT